MHVELSVALNFLMSHLYNKLPRRRVDVFAEELEKGLKSKFAEHWYPEDPFKGSGFRSIRVMEGKIDPLLRVASQLSGLSLEEILEQLPNGLTIWVDPEEVSYRVGETGQVSILYYNRRNPEQTDPISFPDPTSYMNTPNEVSSNADQLGQLLNSFGERNETMNSLNNLMTANQFEQELASSLERLKFESNPSLPYAPINNLMQVPQQNANYLMGLGRSGANHNCFTAAAFAQTKFGSTKMKTHTAQQTRPDKLFNSTDLQSRLSLAAQLNAVNARSPGSLLPFPGLQYDQWNGNQTSAPSSSLNSPINPPFPSQLLHNMLPSQASPQATNQLNLSQHQQLFDCFANGLMTNSAKKQTFLNAPQIETKEATPPSLSPSFCLPNRLPFDPFKQPNYPFNCPSPKLSSEESDSSLDPFSSSSSSTSADNSPPTNIDSIEWNNPLTPYPNIQQLLMAN